MYSKCMSQPSGDTSEKEIAPERSVIPKSREVFKGDINAAVILVQQMTGHEITPAWWAKHVGNDGATEQILDRFDAAFAVFVKERREPTKEDADDQLRQEVMAEATEFERRFGADPEVQPLKQEFFKALREHLAEKYGGELPELADFLVTYRQIIPVLTKKDEQQIARYYNEGVFLSNAANPVVAIAESYGMQPSSAEFQKMIQAVGGRESLEKLQSAAFRHLLATNPEKAPSLANGSMVLQPEHSNISMQPAEVADEVQAILADPELRFAQGRVWNVAISGRSPYVFKFNRGGMEAEAAEALEEYQAVKQALEPFLAVQQVVKLTDGRIMLLQGRLAEDWQSMRAKTGGIEPELATLLQVALQTEANKDVLRDFIKRVQSLQAQGKLLDLLSDNVFMKLEDGKLAIRIIDYGCQLVDHPANQDNNQRINAFLTALATRAELDVQAREQRQLATLSDIAELPLYVYGGFANDALPSGKSERPHGDIDAFIKQADTATVVEALQKQGFEVVNHGSVAGGPQKLTAKKQDVKIDISVVMVEEGGKAPYIDVKNLKGDSYRVFYDADMFNYPEQQLNDHAIRVISPRAMLQVLQTISILKNTTRPSDAAAQARLATKYFLGKDITQLQPHMRLLSPSADASPNS